MLIDADFSGIIPTRVGTSVDKYGVILVHQDHPHACGDKTITNGNNFISIGSSPRVWGQVMCNLYDSFVNGIIPTRVGTS